MYTVADYLKRRIKKDLRNIYSMRLTSNIHMSTCARLLARAVTIAVNNVAKHQ